MRPQYLVGLIIGILLVYLGMMGASGIGFSWSNNGTLPMYENFANLNDWSPYYVGGAIAPAIVNGAMQLRAAEVEGGDDRCAAASQNGRFGSAVNSISVWTMTIQMKVEQFPWTVPASHVDFMVYTSQYSYAFQIYWKHVGMADNSAVNWPMEIPIVTSAINYINYTMITRWSSGETASVDFYFGDQLLGTTTTLGGVWGANPLPRLSIDAWHGTVCDINLVALYPGAVIPGGITPTPTANLSVNAQDTSGNALLVSISAAGNSKTTPATWSSLAKGSVQLMAPSTATVNSVAYTFSSWSDGNSQASRSYDLESDTTLTATYTSGSNPNPTPTSSGNPSPTPTSNPQIFTNLTVFVIGILNNASVRQVEMVIGGLAGLICGVMFVMPAGRRDYPQPPRYYG